MPYRRQGEVENDDGSGSGSGDDYFWGGMMQNINVNNNCGK